MPGITSDAAAERAREASLAFLKRVKLDVKSAKVADRLAVLRREQYDAAEYAARLALAGKAQKILNRVALAIREGRVDANDIDRKKLQAIVVEGLSDYRADLLMRNTLATAFYAGVYDEGMDDPKRGFFYYLTKRDARVRPGHRKWDGLLLPKTHHLVGKIMPPNGHNCRCVARFVTASEAQQLINDGARTKPPQLRYVTYIDSATGKPMRTLDGVDPGWMGNPSDRAPALAALLERQLALLDRTVVN